MGLKALHGPGSGENLHGAFKKSEKKHTSLYVNVPI